LQVSGLSYTWDPAKEAGERVDPADILINGQPLQASQTYSVTVNSFLADGGDNFTVLKEGSEREAGPTDLDALIEYLKQLEQPFGASIEGRINIPLDMFVQVTDLHYGNFADAQKVFQGKYDPQAYAQPFVEEIKALDPSFVVTTGDLVLKAETNPLEKGIEWYDLYLNDIVNPIKSEGIPFYQVPGNHDVGGSKYYKKPEDKEKIPDELKKYFGDGLFTEKTGFATHYSFDQADYHYIVLDPLEAGRTVSLPEEQFNWLQEDLEKNKDKNIILFFHQPSSNWNDWEKIRDLLKDYKVKMMLSGHWHTEEAVDNGFPEQATSSFCGSWWRDIVGKAGAPLGYRLVCPLPGKDGEVLSFYKELGANKQINVISPVDVAIDAGAPLKVQAYDASQLIKDLFYRIDGSEWQPLSMEKIGVWYEGRAALNIVPDGKYHKIEVGYRAADGEIFSKEQSYKFAADKTITVEEIYDQFDEFRGRYATVETTVTAAFADGQMPIIQDKTGGISVWAGECAGRPAFEEGQRITLRGKVATDGDQTRQLHLNDAQNIQITGEQPPTPKAVEIPELSSYYYQLVGVKNVKVTEVAASEFYAEDTQGRKLLIYTGDVRPKYSPQDNLKAGDVLNISGIAWPYLGENEICPRSPEDIQLTADELATAKEEAKNTLDSYKNPADYRQAQKDELTAAITAGKAAIGKAADVDAVNSALAAAKAELDKIKTDARLTAEELAEELAAAKTKAKNELDSYKMLPITAMLKRLSWQTLLPQKKPPSAKRRTSTL
jgi:predicted MPP superfamily phosphohydrolase